MARKCKGIHTSPEKAGEQNLPDSYVNKNKDNQPEITGGVYDVYKKGMENRQDYKGKWDEESLTREINAYLEYSFNNGIKPAKVGLGLWLGIGKSQLYEWAANSKYGFKSELIRGAFEAIELSYIGRAEKYPTANIFLLKSSHEHVEQSKIDVTSNGQSLNSNPDEVKDLVSKLGLDKK